MSDSGFCVEIEIFVCLFDGQGSLVDLQFCVSSMGLDGDIIYDVFDFYVVFNLLSDEYLVVWCGDDNCGGVVQGEFEVFGQCVLVVGVEIGFDDFCISFMGFCGNSQFDVLDFVVVYNLIFDEYFVIWVGFDDLVLGEEVYVQCLCGDGSVLGSVIQVFLMGFDGIGGVVYFVDESFVCFSLQSDEYFVFWMGEDDCQLFFEGEFEVFGQCLMVDGWQVGIDDVCFLSFGLMGDLCYDVFLIDLVYNSVCNEFFIVFLGDDNIGMFVDDEVEIYVQCVVFWLFFCFEDVEIFCFNGGCFEVKVIWKMCQGMMGEGCFESFFFDLGWFWFFDFVNIEFVVKVFDVCVVNGCFWVFYGVLFDVEYVMMVIDIQIGESCEYCNLVGMFVSCGDIVVFLFGVVKV